MDPATSAAVEEWPEVPFSGGYDGLHDLTDQAFTGVVENAGATLYMLNGRVVGVEDGTIEDFETGGTAREGPHDALPLLYAMQFREEGDGSDGVEIRGQYYTEETPIEEVDRTLQEGGFTGYIELSENVLSGDYYVVYQGGKSTSVAFIGNARRVLTEDEAFERTCDEVGIYEVKAVDLDVIEIPGDPASDEGQDESEAQGVLDGSGGSPTVEGIGEVAPGPAGSDDSRERRAGVHDRTEIDEIRDQVAEHGAELDDIRETVAAIRTERERLVATLERLEARVAELEATSAGGRAPTEGEEADADGPELSVGTALSGTNLFVRYDSKSRPTLGDALDRDVSAGDVRENLQIEYHTQFENEHASVDGRDFEGWLTDRPEHRFVRWLTGELPFEIQATGSLSSMRKLAEALPNLDRVALDRPTLVETDGGGRASDEGAGTGEQNGDEADDAGTGEQNGDEADDAGTGNGDEADDAGTGNGDEADDAGAGNGDEADDAGNGSDERDGDTDGAHTRGTADVGSTVEADRSGQTDGQADDEVEPFDLVAYNRMGRPLVVANMETSREPVTEEAMASLVKDATGLATIDDNLAGAFFVTESYFEPGALSIAEDATGGSLLSRDKRESYVKLSRNRGFHLCLVEDREGSFHLTVPQL